MAVYTVTFDPQGGIFLVNGSSATSYAPTYDTDNPSDIAEPTINKLYNQIQRWNTLADGTGSDISFPYTPTGDITLYAIWINSFHTITLNPNGGSSSNSILVADTVSISPLPSATKTGYVLAEWNSLADGEGTSITADYVPTADMTIYAQWVPEFYDSASVSVDSDGDGLIEFSEDANSISQARENKIVRKALTAMPEPFLSGLKLEGEIQLYNPTEDTTLTLNTIDANDVVWVVTDIDGWWTLPEPEVPDLPRGWGDGSYDAVGRWANRILNLTGAFLPQGPEDAFRARSTLIDILSPMVKTQGAGYLLVQEDDLDNPGQKITKAAKVRLSGPPLITSTNARGRHDFSIGLKAVDPIKYEFVSGDPDGYTTETINSSSSWEATIVNKGNVAVPIIIEISGISSVTDPDYPPTITNDANDQIIELAGGVDSGHKLEIDTYNREVLDVTYTLGAVTNVANGRAKLPVLVDWIYLEPGSNRLYVTNEVSGSEWVIYYRSGWIG